MIRDLTRHKGDYSILAIASAIYVVYFLNNKLSPQNLVLSTLVFALVYIAWGIWHHHHNKSLAKGVVLEYVLVGVLGIVIVSSLLI